MCTGKATGAEAADGGQQDGSRDTAGAPGEEKDAAHAALRDQLRALVPESLPAREEAAHAAELALDGGAPATDGAAQTTEQQVHLPSWQLACRGVLRCSEHNTST